MIKSISLIIGLASCAWKAPSFQDRSLGKSRFQKFKCSTGDDCANEGTCESKKCKCAENFFGKDCSLNASAIITLKERKTQKLGDMKTKNANRNFGSKEGVQAALAELVSLFDENSLAVMTDEEINELIDQLSTILNQKGVVKQVDDEILGDSVGLLSRLIAQVQNSNVVEREANEKKDATKKALVIIKKLSRGKLAKITPVNFADTAAIVDSLGNNQKYGVASTDAENSLAISDAGETILPVGVADADFPNVILQDFSVEDPLLEEFPSLVGSMEIVIAGVDEDGAIVEKVVEGLSEPISVVFIQPTADSKDCAYYDEESGNMISMGEAAKSTEDAGNGNTKTTCTSDHLTLFAMADAEDMSAPSSASKIVLSALVLLNFMF